MFTHVDKIIEFSPEITKLRESHIDLEQGITCQHNGYNQISGNLDEDLHGTLNPSPSPRSRSFINSGAWVKSHEI